MSPTADPDRLADLRARVRLAYCADEAAAVAALLPEAAFAAPARARIAGLARRLVARIRERRRGQGGLDAFLHEFGLSTEEGVVLMCLAEALLRIPDPETASRLIRDKIGGADWERHLGHSDSLFVNASTWALMLTGRLVKLRRAAGPSPASFLAALVGRSGEPVVRQALTQAMRIIGRQFVMGRTIDEALARAREAERAGYRHSYDMLGEAAKTAADAARYFDAYAGAIAAIGREGAGRGPVAGPGISVKLSALHPRFEFAQRGRVMRELVPRIVALAGLAKAAGIGLTVDTEEADRLEITLDVIEAVSGAPEIAGWDGFGLALQAYQKRARPAVDWLAAMARAHRRRLMLRLVKGAYWDSEIKRAQEQGLDGYPVFTRKSATDVSYLACARAVLAMPDAFYPQFATHNAHTLAAVIELAGAGREFEFQRLHGMGEALYAEVAGEGRLGLPCRVYAPVGSHEDLLPYLVRRLLENGTNTSFVNRIVDESAPIEALIADPAERVAALAVKPHPRIPLPADLYGPERQNARGLDLSDPLALAPVLKALAEAPAEPLLARPTGARGAGGGRPVLSPADRRRVVGHVVEAGPAELESALAAAVAAAPLWAGTPAEARAAALDRAAAAMERELCPLMALAVREGGKTIADALAEVREAVDFCRYYALQARRHFARAEEMPGPTGELNRVSLAGRGVFACISPWNFPLAIFTGQVAAALAAGNAVIAKPAGQTPLIAAAAVRLLHAAGVPEDALRLLPGTGGGTGARLVADPRIAGVAVTGSTETAAAINRTLAAREGPIMPLIAETGGQNAMIVDSSALPEQVVADVIASAFRSAGQRCSALRVLFLQEEVAEKVLRMLVGAMAELEVGDPARLETDVGPVIDSDARAALAAHAARMAGEGRLLAEAPVDAEATAPGTFFAPRAFEIDSISRLTREVFGPILHVVRFASDRLDSVIEAINATGYGLTFGIHSRIDSTIDHVVKRVRAGNAYVNRNMIGAVVGVQPFGGEGLSGTGPKAGGPRYLFRFATERTLSVNTTAAGGNAPLLGLAEED
ncbi:MAG: bifunctional proline dehydrogenase/L-glutamate gamma-semialdehyde dehydrogenase PutA [Proteobacteria bacterium]|nr:bifunctional proline dehydrogenase/L-glutamate gamma-semialdehyde dehydrogenase PutA [Pseudomonadota bacterium]